MSFKKFIVFTILIVCISTNVQAGPKKTVPNILVTECSGETLPVTPEEKAATPKLERKNTMTPKSAQRSPSFKTTTSKSPLSISVLSKLPHNDHHNVQDDTFKIYAERDCSKLSYWHDYCLASEEYRLELAQYYYQEHHSCILPAIIVAIDKIVDGSGKIKQTDFEEFVPEGQPLLINSGSDYAAFLEQNSHKWNSFYRQILILNWTNSRLKELPLNAIIGLVQIKCLNLSYNELSGLPPEITRLNLHRLNVSHNKFEEFPEVVLGLPHLMELDISWNELTTLPEEIDALASIVFLNFSNNSIAELPEKFSELSRLEVLDLAKNNMPVMQEFLLELPKLKQIWLAHDDVYTLSGVFKMLQDKGLIVIKSAIPQKFFTTTQKAFTKSASSKALM